MGKLSILPASNHQFQSPINEDVQQMSASGWEFEFNGS